MTRTGTLLSAIVLVLLVSSGLNRVESKLAVNAAVAAAPQKFSTVPLYRLIALKVPAGYDATAKPGFHYYTTDLDERNGLINHAGYGDEGIAGYVLPQQAPGTIPLYKLSKISKGWSGNPIAAKHFYTTDKANADNAVKNLGFTFNGVQCYVAPASKPLSGTVPLYMLYHPATHNKESGRTAWNTTFDDDHFYTTNADEKYRAMYKLGYQDYGIACHIWPAQTVYHVVPKISTTPSSGPGNVGSFPPSQQQQAVANDLFKKGCKAFLGRVNQGDFLCTTQAGLDSCEAYKQKGQAKMCRKAR